MNFAFDDEQEEFRTVLQRFLEAKAPMSEVRRWMESPEGFDEGLWKLMAEELGLQGLVIPESHGGQGFSQLELEIVCEEMGRVLFGGPFFSTVCLGAPAIEALGSAAQQDRWLPAVAAGDLRATLAWVEDAGDWNPESVTLEAEARAGGYTLDGRKRFVLDGAGAGWIGVVARCGGELAVFAVSGDAKGLLATPFDTLDGTRLQADLELSGVAAERLGSGDAGPALKGLLDRATVALAAECAGGAERCLRDAVEYAKQRIQFARPIGSFQAIKHRCADLLLEAESAKVAARWAAWVADQDPDALPEAASIAKSVAGDAFVQASEQGLHIHGGMGFTWEADSHLYLKRARVAHELLGTPGHHRDRLARSRGL